MVANRYSYGILWYGVGMVSVTGYGSGIWSCPMVAIVVVDQNIMVRIFSSFFMVYGGEIIVPWRFTILSKLNDEKNL